MEIRSFRIYALYNNVDDDTYIGCTCKTLSNRFADHRYKSAKKTSKLYKKMQEIGVDNFRIVELLSAHVNYIDAHRMEGELIEFFRPALNSRITGKHVRPDGSYDSVAYKGSEERLEYKRTRAMCSCGVMSARNNIARHRKTATHRRDQATE